MCTLAPDGYEVVSANHVATSDPSASMSAYCPTGKSLLGGRVHASAYEDPNGTPLAWILTAYAICALPVTGLETVHSYGSESRDDTRYELLTCPAGKHVLGVGGNVYPSTGEVSFTRIEPGTYGGEDFVVLEAAEDQDGLSEDIQFGHWRMDAWAICAPTIGMLPRF